MSTSSARFEDLGGRTRVSTHTVFPSLASRDGMVANGMEYGGLEGHSQLDELLASS